MAKDYASSQRNRLPVRRTVRWYQQPSSLLWVVGMVVFAAAGVSYSLWPQHHQVSVATATGLATIVEHKPPQTPPHVAQLAQQPIAVPKPRFDFYEILPNQTVKTAYTTLAEQKASAVAAAAAKDDEIAEANGIAPPMTASQAVAHGSAKVASVDVAKVPPASEAVQPKSEAEKKAIAAESEKKVIAAEPEKKATVAEPETKAQVVTEPARNYFLQVASFARFEDADKLRARLLLLGFSAKVEAPQAKGKYYRIVVGPFSRMEVAQQAQQRLTKVNYSSLLLIVKQGQAI